MISPGVYDFTIYQGATFDRNFQFIDSNGDNLSTSGCTVRMQARTSVSDTSKILNMTSGDGTISINATGLVTITLSATITAVLPGVESRNAGYLIYDMEIVNGTVVDRVLMGTITISAEVTR